MELTLRAGCWTKKEEAYKTKIHVKAKNNSYAYDGRTECQTLRCEGAGDSLSNRIASGIQFKVSGWAKTIYHNP
jgi:hypothetical protein